MTGFLRLVLAVLAFTTPAMARSQDSAREQAGDERISNEADFNRKARTETGGRFLGAPRVMFAIDRSKAPPRIHWIDTKRYLYHFSYLQARYLTLADADAFIDANYSKPDRRFVLGAVVRYPLIARYGVEMWEGDKVEPELLAAMMATLQAGFHAPLTFKPNSTQQLEAARAAGLPVIGIDEAYGAREQLVLNRGRAVGRLVLVADGAEDDLLPGDIALLKAMPIRLPPVAGILSSTFTTPINHVSLLAKTWGIPNAYRAEADRLWAGLAGKQVVLDTRGASVTLRPATAAEVRAAEQSRAVRRIRAPRADLTYSGLPALAEQDSGWASRTGAKAANLGEVARLAMKRSELDFVVPPGFSIPFAFYERFVVANGLAPAIEAITRDGRRNDPAWRRDALAALRARFAAGTIPPGDLDAIVARRRALLGDKALFVRSSTNAEDLPGFNGAGLYDTVPNVVEEAALAAAVKTVWGSLWNERAFAARERAGIDHLAVRAAVLMQAGIDADAAGVMTTIDPFDEQADERRIFIAAKRGIGIRVVEGRKIAEQLIYRPELDSIQVLTRSQDDVMLHFAPGGGVEEVRIDPNRAVLSDDLVRRLGTIGGAIQRAFGSRPQDIEWLVVGDRIMIVQSRDYVRG
ncbi:pyruvate, phosphate dikinase [Sphingomonas parva]|uniref:Phosphoenolpyruvate synthase n=1 Tax=Sphingomonas parva TaxID=2555898 RepID=A0A4Y8ZTG1_9SPHN|nr:PEP/pyruvate-binding domain-containing protein [Sphingomonas parva]TFI58582.1 pyruvate, phosphate dikinase [Sphingomonas parva]